MCLLWVVTDEEFDVLMMGVKGILKLFIFWNLTE